jgi:hypothetical protein
MLVVEKELIKCAKKICDNLISKMFALMFFSDKHIVKK